MVRILAARLARVQGVCNPPTFEVLVDRMPTCAELTYDVRENIHVAVCGDIAYMYHYKSPGKGLSGAIVPVTLRNGEKKLLVGPWITCSQASEDVGLTPLVEAAVFTCKESWDNSQTVSAVITEPWNNGHTAIAAFVTVAAYSAWIRRIPHVNVQEWGFDNETRQRTLAEWTEPNPSYQPNR